jgi:2',3'-cyclic-nucleotide 2'-phosphodiesterase (5'-nucleotidase family)
VTIKNMNKEGKNPIILDAGDLFFSTHTLHDSIRSSESYRASAIIKGYGQIGCDAINVGQYELANGLPFLLGITRSTSIPFLSANLRDANTGKLLFEPYIILRRSDLKIGIIGLTDLVPDSIPELIVDNYIITGQEFISKIKKKADIIVMLVNSDRSTYKDLPGHFSEADLIYTSGSTSLTRPMMRQPVEGPYLYSSGREARFLNVTELNIKNKSYPVTNVSYLEEKMNYTRRILDRLQDSDSSKKLEEIYAGQDAVLEKITERRKEIGQTRKILKSAVNTLHFENVPMGKEIIDDESMVSFVNETLSKCNELKQVAN